MDILDIAKGHTKELLGLSSELSENRLKICYRCPLYSKKWGGLCNNRLWYNPNTGDVSATRKVGYKNGCGCRVQAKTRLVNAKCPLEKW